MKSAQSWTQIQEQLISGRQSVACMFEWLCLPWFLVNVDHADVGISVTFGLAAAHRMTVQHRQVLSVEISLLWFTVLQPYSQTADYQHFICMSYKFFCHEGGFSTDIMKC
jgi:hypothetical protein